jgi:hypothetical protein
MPVETDYQGDIVKAVKAQGGYGVKMSNRFLIGVPDLYLKPLGLSSMLVEVKLLTDYPILADTKLAVAITALQRISLLDHQKAGGVSAWLLLVQVRTGVVDMVACSDIDRRFTKKEFQGICSRKTPQTSWWPPLAEQLNLLSSSSSTKS